MFKIEGIGDIFKEVVKEGGLFARLFGKGLLRGRVVDSDGTPLEGVTITIGEKLSQNTSYKGTFLFAKVKGRYEITVQHKDFRIEKFDYVFVKGGQEIEIEVELDSSSQYNSISDRSVESPEEVSSVSIMDESGTSEVVESAQVQISLGYYKIERLQSKTIQVLDLKTKNYIQPVKPILRAIIDELNLDIGGLLLSTGAKKNTRTLGRQVIKALNQSEENPHKLQ